MSADRYGTRYDKNENMDRFLWLFSDFGPDSFYRVQCTWIFALIKVIKNIPART
jgi:hypothetical protein